ncbi:MAG: DUF1501 domain-containing protein [Chthonomonas sp.]|nr:DUF1501 domain-containing protein [Chthonomonas sp.]
MSNELSRRSFLGNTAKIAIGLVAPTWLSTIARADVLRASAGRKIDPEAVLVVLQLSGGNDGLNTVVPYADSRYHQLRPTLGIAEDQALVLAEGLGLHPAMEGMKTLYKEGKVAIINGVGYPKPNRSHFKSMEIWQSASPETNLKYGWLGRHLDILETRSKLNPVFALGLSTDKPRALQADEVSVPCFASLADIQSMVGDPDAERMLRLIQGSGGSEGEAVVRAANKSALDAMVALRDKLKGFTPKETYPADAFGNGFRQISQIIAASPQTRVLYFSAGGFDTHARQVDQHAKLMKGFSDSILAFQREMEALGKADKVMVLVFSEFGRRSYENASGGTDHGAAGPMFLVGKQVKGGLYGPKPDLEKLVDGDVPFSVDFRQVYATALDSWMGGESEKVLGSKFTSLDVLKP